MQKHKARRLHYDFRLELGGVLKSWAVPKGPSTDPQDRRLAVQVEDHPLDYADFEGTIPAGEYGAGSVLVWDRGTWEPEGEEDPARALEKGVLKFSLHGQKLEGSWVLARMGRGEEPNWLLIKHQDPSAAADEDQPVVERLPRSVKSRRTIEEVSQRAGDTFSHGIRLSQLKGVKPGSSFPVEVRPELALLARTPPAGDDWLHELKYDGYRILALKQGKSVRLVSRNGKDWTARFAPVAKALQDLPGEAVVDGEVVVLDPQGRSSFQALQQSLKGKPSGPLVYFAFDLLWFQGHDLRGVALAERKEVLRHLLTTSFREADGMVRFSDHQSGKGGEFFRQACQAGVEGMVSKRAGSKYIGRRTRDWLKLKCGRKQEFVVGGFTPPQGSRTGFGALLLGYYDAERKLCYAGRVGTGFDEALLRDLHRQMLDLEVAACPFARQPPRSEVRKATWVKPQLVAEVVFTEWTDDGRLRQPSFQGLREDKAAKDVRREEAGESGPAERPERQTPKRRTSNPPRSAYEVAGMVISHPDRTVFPDAGVTKGEVAQYYFDIAAWMLPHVANRPLSVVRCPEGREKPCFYQKHLAAGMPDAVGSVRVPNEDERYLTVDSPEGLVALAQFGVLEIHPWLARNDRLDRPDSMVFDLDPGEGVPWEEVLGASFLLRDLLRGFDLESFPKLTGGKGLHVVVPLARRLGFEVVKPVTKAIAERMVDQNPGRFLTSATKAKRKGKIYVDYLRNGQGATAVAAFSLRARPGAPVAVPVSWDEVRPGLKPDAFTLQNVRQRLGKQKADPWAGFSGLAQTLAKGVLRELGGK